MEKISENQAVVAILVRHARAYFEKEDLTKTIASAQTRIGELDAAMADCSTALRVFGHDASNSDEWRKLIETHETQLKFELWGVEPEVEKRAAVIPAPAAAEPQPIYEMVLQALENAGAEGSKAAPIRAHIEKSLGREIHEKTVGMSLYRLLQKKRVRREGHTWFFVPETKNPGAATPGLFNSVDQKE